MGSVFQWSVTRVKTFQECRRRYYYRYLLAPLSRTRDKTPESVQAANLQDLVGLEAWAGQLVHQMIEETLNQWRWGRAFTEQQALARASKLVRQQHRDSWAYCAGERESFQQRPVRLDYHYYKDRGQPKEAIRALEVRILTAISAFFQSDLAEWLRGLDRAGWLPIDRNASVNLEDGTQVLVRPDLAFREDGIVQIIDWKTGRVDTVWSLVQLSCYALYAAQKWEVRPERIQPRIVSLYPRFEEIDIGWTPDAISAVRLRIDETREEMEALLTLDENEVLPPIERFELTSECRACRWCAFREMCEGACRVAERG